MLDPSKIDTSNLFEKVLNLNKKEQSEKIISWCNGREGCIERFKFIVSFSKVSQNLAMEVFYKELAQLKKEMDGKIENPKLLKSIQRFKGSYMELQACQNAMKELGGQDYITKNDSLIIPYPFHNNYMRITGCNSVSGKSCEPVKKTSVDKVIEEAIAMGTDPYLALAISFMEGQPKDMGHLSLDPIGVMDIIGCSSKRQKKAGKGILNSYQTYYKVKGSTIEDSKLSNKLKSFMRKKGTSLVSSGKSHYCYDVAGKNKPKVSRLAQKNSCCLELDFNTAESSSAEITHALTYEFINRKTNSKYKGKSDPAWRIQRFNGFTNLMGGAEAVPAWRVGVNYRKNPGYGQQAMDYMLNSLMFNPYIANKVKDESKIQQKKLNSILCSDKEDGTYYYESDRYFNKVKSSIRLGVIADKYSLGISYDKLTPREQSVIRRELLETAKHNPKMPKLLRSAVIAKYETQVGNNLQIQPENLFETLAVSRESIWKKRGKESNLGRYDFDYIMETWDQESKYNLKLDKANLDINNFEKRLSETCQSSYQRYLDLYAQKQFNKASREYLLHNDCIHNADEFVSAIYNGDNARVIEVLKENATFRKHSLEALRLVGIISGEESKLSSFQKVRYAKMISIFDKDPQGIQKIFESRTSRESYEEAISRIRKLPGYKKSLDEGIRSLYEHQAALEVEINYADAYDQYFKSLYQSRKTLGLASDYSWKKLDNGQIKTILPKILKN
jgi:hypothetical protein